MKKSKAKILVVDDDAAIRQMLDLRLSMAGYDVATVADGQDALAFFEENQADLVVLDVMLPQINGFQVCRQLRQDSSIPVVMLSALGDIKDRIAGLEAGADDYLVKPFSPRELEARIESILRRFRDPASARFVAPGTLEVGEIRIDSNRQQVYKGSDRIALTYTEFKLLELLFEQAGEPVSRAEILEKLWGYAPTRQADLRVIDVYVARVRSKIEADPKNPELILTIRGFGYVAQRRISQLTMDC
ncbi:response regulator [Geitlerinema sp. P-1104]|uniref:response regulator transcription factor RpaB n=1 Tax=Geitlerinema sp. P-1104 TaxID=2546230 RepID=UPI001477439B|nr:response regulator [Geitlerinema sp. P-1104]NMG57776.1 response regulator [Geitlerinema sp. P-1104]